MAKKSTLQRMAALRARKAAIAAEAIAEANAEVAVAVNANALPPPTASFDANRPTTPLIHLDSLPGPSTTTPMTTDAPTLTLMTTDAPAATTTPMTTDAPAATTNPIAINRKRPLTTLLTSSSSLAGPSTPTPTPRKRGRMSNAAIAAMIAAAQPPAPPPMTGAERITRYRETVAPERAEEIRQQDASQHQQQRSQLAPERAEEIRQQNASQHQQQRSQLAPERAEEIRQQDAAQHREVYPPPVSRHQRLAILAAEQLQQDYANFIQPNEGEDGPPHYGPLAIFSVGDFNVQCQFCHAFHFAGERTRDGNFSNCCLKGRLRLPPVQVPYPRWIRNALTDPTDVFYEELRSRIRNYNCALSFVSLGARMTPPPGHGGYCFRINGTIHHFMPNLQVPGDENHRYAQLYIMDSSTQATDIRMRHPGSVDSDPRLMRLLTDYIVEKNLYAAIFHSVNDRLRGHDEPVELVFNREFMPGYHAGRQNVPAGGVNEVAAVFVMDEDDGLPNFHRDFAVFARPEAGAVNTNAYVNPTSPHLDPLTYVLLFPHGEPGWTINWRCEPYIRRGNNNNNENAQEDRRITLREFKAAELQVRPLDDQWRPILHAGNLTQQFIVDSYVQYQANALTWVRMHQDVIYADSYRRLNRFVQNQAVQQGRTAAATVILPSTFTGSERSMRQLCIDGVAIFGHVGAPDLFITLTTNPAWKEITESILPGEQPHDRPDIVARVFYLKLKEVIRLLTGGLFGPVRGFVYTIEFQMRGLPHAHMLLTLENKPLTAEEIDRIVIAELPDPVLNPELFAIVSRVMIHRTCRPEWCLDENGRCKKGFPKRPQAETVIVPNSYPLYRRRFHPARKVGTRTVTNGNVVPYNPFLLLHLDAHVNVEVVTHMNAHIKYLYKYVFKGFDVASLSFTRNGQLIVDEINNHINARYVSAPEAIWRLFEFPTHDRSHTVVRLPIHLEQQEVIEFDEGMEIPPEREDEMTMSMLDAFFVLNQDDQSPSRQMFYRDIPVHYVWNARQRRWNPRQQRGNRVVARIRNVSANAIEMFSLRVLLLNVRGPSSFRTLRTVRGVLHPTFREAAQALNLIRNDDVMYNTMDELAQLQMPPQLRQFFAILLRTSMITSGLVFWERYRHEMIADFRRIPVLRNATDDDLYNYALHDLNRRFMLDGKSNRTYGLPLPDGDMPDFNAIQPPPAPADPDAAVVLNPAQQRGFDAIMAAVGARDDPAYQQRCFVVIGPGGSGKTTLYKSIIAAVKARGEVPLAFATTGIAATLMDGGTTAHRGFGIPVDLTPESKSYLERNRNSDNCRRLRGAAVILIDEITMMSKHGLRVVDKVLQFIMGNTTAFGGKIIVVGGDFRQLLPIVQGGTRAHIVSEAVISSNLWRNFKVISLSDNMRAQGNPEFIDWLLKLGTGSAPSCPGNPNFVEIPPALLLNVPPQPPRPVNQPFNPDEMPHPLSCMIKKVFGDDVNRLTPEDLQSRAILVATLKEAMKVNNYIIGQLNTQEEEYLSTDSLLSDDPNDELNFPVEYLNAQQQSGMPPHKLVLKVGAVVILLRNLSPTEGLSNGTRLIVTQLRPNAIVARILSESHRGETVYIARSELSRKDNTMPFQLLRQQLPLLPAYAMTFNKSQGQTFDHVGVYLNNVVFAHGQLYVAMSRSRNPNNIAVYIRDSGNYQGHLLRNAPGQRHRVFTLNVVYREVFLNGELQATLPDLEDIDADLAMHIQNAILEDDAEVTEARELAIDEQLGNFLDDMENQQDDMDDDMDDEYFDQGVDFIIGNEQHGGVRRLFNGDHLQGAMEHDLQRMEQEFIQRGEHWRFLLGVAHFDSFADDINTELSQEDINEERESYMYGLRMFIAGTDLLQMTVDELQSDHIDVYQLPNLKFVHKE